MSIPTSRPVHPCVLSITEGTRGAEHSTWAYITSPRCRANLPNLVTASASTLAVYSVDELTGRLYLEHVYPHLNGNVVHLTTLPSSQDSVPDALLVGWAGAPRFTVVQVTPNLLQADCLVDLTAALQDASHGAVTPLEQDVVLCCRTSDRRPGSAVVAAVLGGGVAVAVVDVTLHKGSSIWRAGQPYILPLSHLAESMPHIAALRAGANWNLGHSMSTGFGDIISATFLSGYVEPVLVLLHSEQGGRTFPGRLGRTTDPVDNGAPPLFATALSVGVTHRRAAVLWCCAVTSDSQFLSPFGNATQCLVVGVNTLIVLEAGIVQHVLAVNGWARSTCPLSLMSSIQPNPMIKLALSLDGCAVAWVSPQAAILSLRTGQLYVLQQSLNKQWTLLPLGRTLGGIGEIEQLVTLPFEHSSASVLSSMLGEKAQELSAGLMFAGSRLGNSLLLGYALESMDLPLADKHTVFPVKDETLSAYTPFTQRYNEVDEDYDRILQTEEAALYASTPLDSIPDVVPESDDEGERGVEASIKRPRLSTFTMVKILTPLDSIVNLGPLGSSCVGPISKAPSFLLESTEDSNTTFPLPKQVSVYGAPALVFPSGFGSSGGIALATLPGRDDRLILTEADCLNVEATFSLPQSGVVLLCLSQKSAVRTRILQLQAPSTGNHYKLEEVKPEEWCVTPALDILLNGSILQAGEFADGTILMVTRTEQDSCVCVILRRVGVDSPLEVVTKVSLNAGDRELFQITPFIERELGNTAALSFVCLWSSGEAVLYTLSEKGELSSLALGKRSKDIVSSAMDVDGFNDDDDDEGVKEFYRDAAIVSVDVLKSPIGLFSKGATANSTATNEGERDPGTAEFPEVRSYFDDDEEELYCISSLKATMNVSKSSRTTAEMEASGDTVYVVICRQSGGLEFYSIEDSIADPIWQAKGCGQGSIILGDDSLLAVSPKHHKVFVQEMRLFSCGPALHTKSRNMNGRKVCLALELSSGDVELYVSARNAALEPVFRKVPLRVVTRPSLEQGRHRTKLVRRGMVEKGTNEHSRSFSHNHLFRFSDISGQDGLFSISARPFWVVSERGRPSILFHQLRHAAPAGGKERPVSGFCPSLRIPNNQGNGFLIVHERVGRVGSQRLTAFNGLARVFASQGVLGGLSGFCFEKVSLGVTVRRIEFINDAAASSGDHPLYAMLVSRDTYIDQGSKNSDGLSNDERRKKQEEKEQAKIRKQVEADLGGFDLESEWVEEIEREDCFKIDVDLGGAPPLRSQVYSVWIVDASNNWMVVDSFELDTYEHGVSLSVMHLSEFTDEPGSTSSGSDDELGSQLFIVVGTGYVDHNGEDVSSKGRVLMFHIKRSAQDDALSTLNIAELSLKYEKQIFHGPVYSLSCLRADGKSRLVIGAGADVNIEQWGNDRLTQVGFFRATMQILHILIFKNFFLLSDAYDSLYFLVWRESDKSLTLLAKDYDPIPVHATGLMSRGATVSFLCHDERQNLQFFQYAPGEAAARGGNKLVCRADFYLGTQTTSILSHCCPSSVTVHSATPASTLAALRQQDSTSGRSDEDQKIAAFFGTTDGGLGASVPLSEPVFWRLVALQSVMANALETNCALSSRAWRLYRRTPRRGGCRSNDRKKGVIDGDLVFQFAFLPRADQEDLASAIGSTADLILDNILEIQCGIMLL